METKEQRRKRYLENRGGDIKRAKRWNKENPKRQKENIQEWRKNNKERIKKYSSQWRIQKREHLKDYNSKYFIKYYPIKKEEIKENVRQYRIKNPKKIKMMQKNWVKKNREYVTKKMKERRENDVEFDTICKLRISLYNAIKNYSETKKIMSSRKYGINYKAIIENLKPFPKDMSKYHIDHIIPLSWFDFNNSKEIKWAFAPENHQWMLARDNIIKGNKGILISQT
ncbi:hypothetical protein LCGC14_0462280 [marine sediment metagenome]|uniref:Uncharacterized protein n=1 Tax=marine sediment metagenome TaxID=412755 RepID=A0A0F9SJY9_9ZZZZ